MTVRALIVGESNPYGADPSFALYHLPRGASGDRLRRIMGLTDEQYEGWFDKVNLLDAGSWNRPAARAAADRLDARCARGLPFVLLGARVRAAFGLGGVSEFSVLAAKRPRVMIVLPHPSGRCMAWHRPGAIDDARLALRTARVLPAPGTDGYDPPAGALGPPGAS